REGLSPPHSDRLLQHHPSHASSRGPGRHKRGDAMAPRSLPNRPSLDQLSVQAKELKNAARAGDPDAVERLRPYVPPGAQATLSVAQRAIAHEYGFPSWPKLRAEVEGRTVDLAEWVDAFLRASVGGPERRAAQL